MMDSSRMLRLQQHKREMKRRKLKRQEAERARLESRKEQGTMPKTKAKGGSRD